MCDVCYVAQISFADGTTQCPVCGRISDNDDFDDDEQLPDAPKGFWTNLDGATVHVQGDPDMPQETLEALGRVIAAAKKMLEERAQQRGKE